MASVGTELLGRIKKIWAGLSRTMRWLIAGLAGALVVSLAVTWYLQRPQWEAFYKATDPTEVATLVEQLDELQVQYRLTGDGLTIMVPSSERSTANLAKAQAGLPSGGHVGLEIFAEPQFGATEFDKKVNYKRAIEGELSRSLMRIADIQYAKVNLNLPEKSVFVRDQQEPSASVLIQPRSGRTLSKETVAGIVQFVTDSVEGLEAERVTVINDKGVELSSSLDSEFTAGMDAETLAQQRQREEQLTRKVLSVLEPVFGQGNVAASVTVEIEHQSSRTEERIVGQGVPVSTTTERSGSQTQGSSSGTASGTTGGTTDATTTSPPIYQTPTTEQTSGESYTNKSETQYEVGERNQVTVSPAGSVKRISTAVTINRETLTQAQITQIREAVANATGATTADVSVLAMSFTPDPNELIQTPARAQTRFLDPTALAIGLGLASLLLIIAALLTRRRRQEPEFALPGVPGQPAAGTTLDVALGLDHPLPVQQAAAALAVQSEGTPEAAAPEGAQPTAAEKLEQVLKKRRPPRQPLDPEDFADDDILADIDVLIEQAPEASAEVIRQWLKGGL